MNGDAWNGSLQAWILAVLTTAGERVQLLWQSLAALPDDWRRLGTVLSDAWLTGDGLRAVTYGLVILMIGASAEWLYWCYAIGVSRGLVPAQALAPGPLVRRALQRLALEAFGILLFVVAVIGASSAFAWPVGVQETVITVAVIATAIRLARCIARFWLSPRPRLLRVLPLPDETAREIYRLILAAVTIAVIGWLAADLAERTLAATALANGLRLIAATLLAILAIVAVAGWQKRRPMAEGRRRRRTPVLPFVAVVVVLATYAMWLAGLWAPVWTIVILAALALCDATIRAVIDLFAGSPDQIVTQDAAVEPDLGFAATYRPALRSLARLLLSLPALVAIASVWGMEMDDLWRPDSLAGRIVGGLAGTAIVAFAADFAWVWARTAIDSRLGRVAPDDAHGKNPNARLATLLPLLRTFLMVVLLVIVVLSALSAMGIQIGPLLAGAGIVGVAIGFGSQTLVKDIISGMFFLFDDAFRVGEYIESGSLRGTVEGFSVRSVKLRHHRGALHTVAFGSLETITNYSRDWVIDKITVGVTYDSDLDRVKKVIKQISAEIMADPELAKDVIEPLKSQGVSAMGDFAIQIKMKIKTRPGEQFVIRRTIYDKLKKAFAANAIQFAFPTVTVAGGPTDAAASPAIAQHALDLAKAAQAPV